MSGRVEAEEQVIELFGKQQYRRPEQGSGSTARSLALDSVKTENSQLATAGSIEFERVRRITCNPALERRIVVNTGQGHPGQGHPGQGHPGKEKLRMLNHRLLQLRQTRRLRTLVVTSAVPEEGKTVVAANLALMLASTESRVMLIDGDIRRPSIQKIFAVELGMGLAGCLADQAGLSESLRCLEPSGLYLLDAGNPLGDPVDLLQKAQLPRLLQTGNANFDWVVIDSPPVIPFADAHFLGSLADAVVLVARAGVTRPAEFERAVQSLKGVYIAGTVLNGYDEPEERYYYAYYNRHTAATPRKTDRDE